MSVHRRYSKVMMIRVAINAFAPGAFLAFLGFFFVAASTSVAAQGPDAETVVPGFIQEWAGALDRINSSGPQLARNHLIPLGAMQKLRGVWAPRDSERVSGTLLTRSWRVTEGFGALEVLGALEESLAGASAQLLFACDARACGSSSQWASRIFSQRLLYGTEASQRYRCYSLSLDGEEYRILVYTAARTASRQYLHFEQISLALADAG